jgi:hypothetical protein
VLARRLEVASIKGAAIPPAVALLKSDRWGRAITRVAVTAVGS